MAPVSPPPDAKSLGNGVSVWVASTVPFHTGGHKSLLFRSPWLKHALLRVQIEMPFRYFCSPKSIFNCATTEGVCVCAHACMCGRGLEFFPSAFLYIAPPAWLKLPFPKLSLWSPQASPLYCAEWLSYVWAPGAKLYTQTQHHQRSALLNKIHWS